MLQIKESIEYTVLYTINKALRFRANEHNKCHKLYFGFSQKNVFCCLFGGKLDKVNMVKPQLLIPVRMIC